MVAVVAVVAGPRWWAWRADLAALLVLVRLATWLKPAANALRLVAQGIPLLLGLEGVPVEPFGSQTRLGYLPFHSPMLSLPQASQIRLRCRELAFWRISVRWLWGTVVAGSL